MKPKVYKRGDTMIEFDITIKKRIWSLCVLPSFVYVRKNNVVGVWWSSARYIVSVFDLRWLVFKLVLTHSRFDVNGNKLE